MKFWLTVKWIQDKHYEVDLLEFTQSWKDGFIKCNTIQLVFKYQYDQTEYKYIWDSNPQNGLSSLYQESKGGWKLVYTPWQGMEMVSTYHELHEIGRQLSILFRQKTTPKEETNKH